MTDDKIKTFVPSRELERRKAEASRMADRYISKDGGAPELDDLGDLSPAEYGQRRKAMADDLGTSIAFLDDEYRERRKATKDGGGDGAFLYAPEPWPDPVNGADLLNEISHVATKHIVLPKGAADAIALWVMFTHAHDCFDISPLLAATSPTPECGKTTLLRVLAALTPRALSASNISPSSVFRTVDKWGPTLLVDEADSFARDNDELRGILNCGHDRSGAFVIRTVGDSHEPKQFCTWAPKAIAMIGKLPVTWQSRSIHIALKRMFPGDYVDPLRQGKTRHLDPLKRKAARWAVDHVNDLRAADPQIPESLYGRAADNWRPLIAIADLAGGDWPDRGRRVAEKFGGRREDLAPIQALEDIAAMFVTKGEKVIKSEEVVAALIKMEHRPWPEWKKEKPITTRQLAALLEPFEIAPKQHWVEGENRRGYHVDQFEDARQRYFGGEHTLPKTPSGGTFAARPLDPAENSHFSDPLAARGDEFLADHPLGGDGVLADRPSKKPQKPKASSGIADKKPEKGILGDSDPFATLKDQRLRLQPEVEMPDLPDFLDRRGR